jgi:hypothetical protein
MGTSGPCESGTRPTATRSATPSPTTTGRWRQWRSAAPAGTTGWVGGHLGDGSYSSPLAGTRQCEFGTRRPAPRSATLSPATPARRRPLALGRVGHCDVIVSCGGDGTVRISDAATGDPIGNPVTGHSGAVTALALGRIGDRDVIVSGDMEGTVRVWDPVTGATLHTADLLRLATALAVGRGGHVYIATARRVRPSCTQDQTARPTGHIAAPPPNCARVAGFRARRPAWHSAWSLT